VVLHDDVDGEAPHNPIVEVGWHTMEGVVPVVVLLLRVPEEEPMPDEE
jgi:hypothetical protein